MGTLAQDTGGTLFENNNDLEAGFRRVAATPETYYTLTFSPDNLKHDGTFHPLKVTLVSGKGLSVQARKGYYAPKKSEDLAAQETEDLQDAAFSTDEVQGLPIQVNTQYFMLNKTDAEIDVVTHVDFAASAFPQGRGSQPRHPDPGDRRCSISMATTLRASRKFWNCVCAT